MNQPQPATKSRQRGTSPQAVRTTNGEDAQRQQKPAAGQALPAGLTLLVIASIVVILLGSVIAYLI